MILVEFCCCCFLTIHSQFADRDALQMRHVSKSREYDKTCQDAGEGVDDGYSQGVPVGREDTFISLSHCPVIIIITTDGSLLLQNVVVEGVVAGHGQEGAETNPNGVEDLSCSIHPHLQHRVMKTTDHCQYQSSIPSTNLPVSCSPVSDRTSLSVSSLSPPLRAACPIPARWRKLSHLMLQEAAHYWSAEQSG